MQANQACAKEIKFSNYSSDFSGDTSGGPGVLISPAEHTLLLIPKSLVSYLISPLFFIMLNIVVIKIVSEFNSKLF